LPLRPGMAAGGFGFALLVRTGLGCSTVGGSPPFCRGKASGPTFGLLSGAAIGGLDVSYFRFAVGRVSPSGFRISAKPSGLSALTVKPSADAAMTI